MDDLLMIIGILLLFIGLPTSIVVTIVFAIKKKKITIPVICIPLSLVLSMFCLMLGASMYSKTDEYKQSQERKRIEEEQARATETKIEEQATYEIKTETKVDNPIETTVQENTEETKIEKNTVVQTDAIETEKQDINKEEKTENSTVLYYMNLYENYEDYLGQYVTISAPLSYVKNETVNIKGDIEGATGMIHIALSENDKNLSEGDYVTVTGRIDKKALGYLYMKDAHILEVGDNPHEIYNRQKEEYDKLLAQNTEENENISDEKEDNENADNTFHVGDVLETKSVRLSFLSCGEYQDSNMFVKSGEGNKFVYFEFEFENIGSTDTSVGYFDFDCYADGYEADSVLITADNAMTSITSISPKRKLSGIVVFEVPKNAESIEVEYETSFWTQKKAIFVYE